MSSTPRTSSEIDRLPKYQHAFPESQVVTYTGEGFPDFKQQIIYSCAKDGQPLTQPYDLHTHGQQLHQTLND